MPLYQLGSQGPEVAQLQTRLKELGLYAGPLDADFGGGTLAAVKAFQQANGLTVDGQVGPQTWAALFAGAAIAEPAIVQQPLAYRCLALTGSFETGTAPPDCFAGLSGDFDGQGLSFGVLQWNLGQGTLQPLLSEIDRTQPVLTRQIFDTHYAEFQAMLGVDHDDQLLWARSIQDRATFRLVEPWAGMFKTLGRAPEFQNIETKYAQQLYQDATALCGLYSVSSERAVALMFDIKVQNGSINTVVQAQIQRDCAGLDPALQGDDLEVARLQIIANRRAEAANPQWVEDVRQRKLTIANGTGVVHGRQYDLAAQYGIHLKPAGA
jgi:peptidoglycan hydrolase-like protein with peptidoglycan-binding domain